MIRRVSRKGFLTMLGLGAAAAALVPHVEPVQAAKTPAEIASEIDAHVRETYPRETAQWADRIDDVLMNPEKYPDLMARAIEMRGEPAYGTNTLSLGQSPAWSGPSPIRGVVDAVETEPAIIGFYGATPVTVAEFDAMYFDTIAQARADGYNAGYTQAALRAESRQVLPGESKG